MPESTGLDAQQFPWLEYFPEGGTRVHRTPLDRTTVTIGRSEEAEVQIDSTKVSREHARIVHLEGRYEIRDLGSTNGTFVNGQQIDRVVLSDGDAILVADTELAYLVDSTSRLRRMATQQMATAPIPRRTGDTHPVRRQTVDVVLALRQTHEQLARNMVQVPLRSIVEFPDEIEFAQLLLPPWEGLASVESTASFLAPPSHALMRLHEVSRSAAVRRCADHADTTRIIVPLDAWEIEENGGLIWHFETLATALPAGVRLIASVKACDAVDLPDVAEFCRDLHEIGVGIACADFVGTYAQVEDLAELRPELLLLSPKLTDGTPGATQHQGRLESIVDASARLGIRPVAESAENDSVRDSFVGQGLSLFLSGHDVQQRGEPVQSEEIAPALAL